MKKDSYVRKFCYSLGCLAAVLILIIPAPVQASSLGVFTSGQITDWDAGTGINFGLGAWQYAPTGPLSSDTGLVSFGNAYGRSSARADYGSLGASAYRHSVDYDTSSTASASAAFTETFIINAPGLYGTTGRLNVWVDVNGGIGGTFLHPGVVGGSWWAVRLGDSYYSEVSSWDYSTNSGRESYSGFLGQTAMFQYGVPFDVTITLSVSAGSAYSSLEENWANYMGTLTFNLAQSQVLDTDSNLVTDYTYTTGSGHDYSAVPIPAALWLFGSGLLGLIGFGARSRKPR